MKYLNLSFSTPEENLACDEALLDLCEDEAHDGEILRFWESTDYFAALGYSNRVREEVHQAACKRLSIPLLRRPSGGGTVLQGPGCLNYALILKISDNSLRNITTTNRYVMERILRALDPLLGSGVEIQGDTDLTFLSRKFSGNAQRRKRRYLLFHGTFLLHLDLELIEKILRKPKRQPAYRQGRSHKDFLLNLHLPSDLIRQTLRDTWQANHLFHEVPHDRIRALVTNRYAQREWNYKF